MPAALTYEDYCQIPEDGNRYEVIDGKLCMSPSPAYNHQRVSFILSLKVGGYIEESGLGYMLAAPMDVVLSERDIVQPDLLFISKEQASIISEKNIQGAPDLLIEILSEGNRRDDEVRKRDLYESYGVQEYWIVDPVLETIKVFRLEASKYKRIVEWNLEADDVITTPLLPGFECRLANVFEGGGKE